MIQGISKGTDLPELLQECCCSNCMLNSMEMGGFAGRKEIIKCTSPFGENSEGPAADRITEEGTEGKDYHILSRGGYKASKACKIITHSQETFV